MRIQKLDENSKKNLLEDLLKRSPNQYTQYEERVNAILDKVKTERDAANARCRSLFEGGQYVLLLRNYYTATVPQ